VHELIAKLMKHQMGSVDRRFVTDVESTADVTYSQMGSEYAGEQAFNCQSTAEVMFRQMGS
jgi:hypothetical protein